MKQSEFRSIINECVREVLAEGRKTKKSVKNEKVKKAIKEILTENELDESELEEIFGFGNKPVTDEDINKYLAGRPKDKALLDKDPERKAKFFEFVKKDKNAGKAAQSGEVILAFWDPAKKEYSAQKSTASNTATSFGEGKIRK